MDGKIPGLNLISQVKAEKVFRPRGFYKSIVFDCLTVLSSLGAGYAYSSYLNSTVSLTLLLTAFGLFLTFSALQVFLTKSSDRRFLVILLETVAFLLYFYSYDLKLLGMSALVFLFFYLWGTISARGELQNSLKIKFFRTVRPVLGRLTTAFALVVVILYLERWDQKNIFVSEETFQGVFSWAVGFTNNFYPDLNISSSFDKLLENLTRVQLQNNAAYNALNPDSQQSAFKNATNETRVSLGTRLGINISLGESTGKVAYDFLIKMLNDWRNRFQRLFIVGWIIAVFLIIRGIGSILTLLIGFISFVVYQIMIASDFIHISGETASKEVIGF